jgi:hypothetical protein
MGLTIFCALLAAVLYGIGAALEQQQAAAVPVSSAGWPKLLARLVRRPAWLLGITAQIGGFAAHAAALRSGPLTIVQMAVAAELIVSVAIVRVRSGQPLPRTAWAAGAAIVAGIAAFLALTSCGVSGQGHEHTGAAAVPTGAATLGAAAIVVAAVGLSAAGRRRALLLAVAAGLADACVAVVTMALGQVSGHGLAAIAGSWPVYALLACGPSSVLLTQTAYQAARPMITLPVIAAVTPVASVTVGIVFLGETARLGAARVIAAGVVALGTGAALVILARCAPSCHREAAPRPVMITGHPSPRPRSGCHQGPVCRRGPRPGRRAARCGRGRGRDGARLCREPGLPCRAPRPDRVPQAGRPRGPGA